jgi:hypothetical protein
LETLRETAKRMEQNLRKMRAKEVFEHDFA